MNPKVVAIRKRTQIAMANRTMFLWVAGASILVGFSVVVAISFTQTLLFNERVLAEKSKTVSALKSNNANISKLQDEIRVLDTNQSLIDIKATSDDKAIQVILDALPSEANSLALGASIQNKLLNGIDGLSLNALQVDPVYGIESLNSSSISENAVSSGSNSQISFRFSVEGSEAALKQALTKLELSIRTIDILNLKIDGQGSSSLMSIQGRAFYEPERVVKLAEKTVK